MSRLLTDAARPETAPLLVIVLALAVLALATLATAVTWRGITHLFMAAGGPRFNVGAACPVPPPGPGAPIDTTPRFGGPLPAQGSHGAVGAHAGHHGVPGCPPPPGWPNYPGATFQPADPPPSVRGRRGALPTR